jgi:hypothetical protein
LGGGFIHGLLYTTTHRIARSRPQPRPLRPPRPPPSPHPVGGGGENESGTLDKKKYGNTRDGDAAASLFSMTCTHREIAGGTQAVAVHGLVLVLVVVVERAVGAVSHAPRPAREKREGKERKKRKQHQRPQEKYKRKGWMVLRDSSHSHRVAVERRKPPARHARTMADVARGAARRRQTLNPPFPHGPAVC